MQTFTELKKKNKNINPDFKVIKVALLGDSATQFLVQALRGAGVNCEFNLDIWEADFNQIERQVLDPSSDLYEFKPELVIVFQSSHSLLKKYGRLEATQYVNFADDEMSKIELIFSTIIKKLNVNIIYYNFPEINDYVYGNYANKLELSFLFQLRKLNYLLMNFSVGKSAFHICDLSSIQNTLGKNYLFQSSVYINSEMVLSIDVLPEVALKTLDLIGAMHGRLRKCLVLDLDNTLWGGVIGDDGIENIQIGGLGIGKAFTEFQYWVKKLKNRGVIIAICSKNTEKTAKAVFEMHPDMVLRMEDISVFVANWENKVDNIRKIQSILNVSFESMVFLDDNPFERNFVRENIPAILVPELPEDPADYLEYLYTLNLFETISFSNEDSNRSGLYQIEAKRVKLQESFTNEDDFLKSLKMRSLMEPLGSFNIPRVAQLSQRSNQFNLRTIRYTEQELGVISTSNDYITCSFTLADKFGDNGLISVVILKKEVDSGLFIESWFMSCRVLKRGMENFIINSIVSIAKEIGVDYIKGEYIPTLKNELVEAHYEKLGFYNEGKYWYLNTEDFKEYNCYIDYDKKTL